jgi:diguanylate cyclase (GGDEF)-like protein/PAS domain S-box-containing protein
MKNPADALTCASQPGDDPSPATFDGVTRLASGIARAPSAIVSLFDADRQIIKSAQGMPASFGAGTLLPVTHSLCRFVRDRREAVRIDDARRAEWLRGHPAISEFGVAAYLGVPLLKADGGFLGTLCVIDTKPRRWTDAQVERLRDLAAVAVEMTGLRTSLAAERALKGEIARQDARLRMLLAHLNQGVALFGEDRRLLYANQRYADIFCIPMQRLTPGIALAEIVALRVEHGSMRAEDAAAYVQRWSAAVTDPAGGSAELRLPDDRIVHIAYRRTPDGGWVMTCEDITARLAAEAAIRMREQRFRILADNSSDVIILGSHTGERSYFSPSVERLTGYQPQEALAIPLRDLVHPDDIALLFRATASLSPANPVVHASHRLKRKDGTYVWVEGAYSYVAEEGSDPYVVAAIRDVSGRKAIEAEYSNLFEHSIVGIYRRDLDGRLLRANPALARMRGFATEAEVLAADREDGWFEDDDARRERRKRLLREGVLSDSVFAVKREADGARRWVSETAWLVRDDAGRPLYVEGTLADVTERIESEEALRRVATYDSLSGCLTRRSFVAALDAKLSGRDHGAHAATGTSCGVAVLYVDLDRFKAINDSYGHAAGDRLICQVAERLAREAATGMIARLGGDEFAIMLDEHAPNVAEQTAVRLIAALNHPFDLSDGVVANIGASIGIARGDGAVGAEELLRRADLAMFQAKRDGRNAFRAHAPELDAALREKRRLEQGLRDALAHDELRLAFQPIVELHSGRLAGYEALLRWEGASPAVAIPIAEETGLIIPIGEWVLAQALGRLALLPDDLRMAVNVSVHQLRHPAFIGCLVAALRRTGVDPARVEIEVTESVLLDDSPATLDTLRRMQALGITVALDDFGTGWSSLSYLNRHRFDRIKIDQAFVRDIKDRRNLAIVHAVLELGRRLGIAVTAEGIETEEQRMLLLELGCREGQGWLLGRPRLELPDTQTEAKSRSAA